MRFAPTPLKDAYLIDLETRDDDRGFFARIFCATEFQNHGLRNQFIQINDSWNVHKGTLRGLHYQLSPKLEIKVVRCVRGALYDVIVDLRPSSPTFGKWFGTLLTEENRTMIYVPGNFAHGFLTLEDNTEAIYLASASYAPDFERGLRWDDPKFKIKWPRKPAVISDKDRKHPDFDPGYHLSEDA